MMMMGQERLVLRSSNILVKTTKLLKNTEEISAEHYMFKLSLTHKTNQVRADLLMHLCYQLLPRSIFLIQQSLLFYH